MRAVSRLPVNRSEPARRHAACNINYTKVKPPRHDLLAVRWTKMNDTNYQFRDRCERFFGVFEDAYEWMIERLCGKFELCERYLRARRQRRVNRRRAIG